MPLIPPTFPWNHRPRLWLESPRLEFPKREREGDEASFDLEVSNRPPKRLASGKSASDTEIAPTSVCSQKDEPKPAYPLPQLQLVPARVVSEFGTSSHVKPHSHYSLSDIFKNPLCNYPSSMALYGVETDGTILNLPIFPANWGGTKGRKLLRGVKMALRFMFWKQLMLRRFRAPLSLFALGRTTRSVLKPFILFRIAMIFFAFMNYQKGRLPLAAVYIPGLMGFVWDQRPPGLGRTMFRM